MKKLLKVIGALLVVLVFAVLFIFFLRPNNIISKAEAKEKFKYPESKFIYWHSAEIHYTDTGTGPPILFIHGFGGSFTNMEPIAHILQANHRVICMDLPGFGLSDMPEDHGKDFTSMYRNFTSFMLAHLHLDSVYVVGNSMGGWMSWELASNQPNKVKRLVLLNSAGYDLEKVEKNLGVSGFLKSPLAPLLAQRGMPMSISTKNAKKIRGKDSPINPNEVYTSNQLINRKGNIQNMLMLLTSGEKADTAKIAKVACPTLIIWGKQDVIVPVEHASRFKRDIPNSQLIIYDDCGHVPMMEQPDRAAKDIEAFLSGKVQ